MDKVDLFDIYQLTLVKRVNSILAICSFGIPIVTKALIAENQIAIIISVIACLLLLGNSVANVEAVNNYHILGGIKQIRVTTFGLKPFLPNMKKVKENKLRLFIFFWAFQFTGRISRWPGVICNYDEDDEPQFN